MRAWNGTFRYCCFEIRLLDMKKLQLTSLELERLQYRAGIRGGLERQSLDGKRRIRAIHDETNEEQKFLHHEVY